KKDNDYSYYGYDKNYSYGNYNYNQNSNNSYNNSSNNNSSNNSKKEYQSFTSKNPYQVLGCKETDSTDTIKKAYKKLIKAFHPDIIAGYNLHEDFITFAKIRTQQINDAYNKIRKLRGF
ncbi:MAG: DnaJ domain-containing protein, partial [Epsilonproteobacteria bacterium]|nr:DnaJ domain-containing protein [Campylobacterota bacterium]